MAVYAITGKLGSGKGKAALKIARDYLQAGKRVATNIDMFLEHLMLPQSRASVIRMPDKPSASDLYAIGSGNRFVEFTPNCRRTENGYEFIPPSPRILPGFDEQHNGALILDECASWLNARDFQSKGRSELLEWAIHARKYGWDVYFITQNISQIDKQLRDSLFEYVVRLNRLDRMKIPFVSSGIKLLTAGFSDGSLPRLHVAVVRLGCSPDGIVADRWAYRGDDLNNAYNTTQVFSDSYPHAIHSLLPSWHLQANVGIPADFVGPVRIPHDYQLLKARPLPPKPPHRHMTKFLAVALSMGFLIGAFGMRYAMPLTVTSIDSPPPKVPKFSDTILGRGFMTNNGAVTVVLSDGRVVAPRQFRTFSGGWEAEISEELWVKGGAQ